MACPSAVNRHPRTAVPSMTRWIDVQMTGRQCFVQETGGAERSCSPRTPRPPVPNGRVNSHLGRWRKPGSFTGAGGSNTTRTARDPTPRTAALSSLFQQRHDWLAIARVNDACQGACAPCASERTPFEATRIDFWFCGAEKYRTGFAFWTRHCSACVTNAEGSEVYGLITYHWSISPRIYRKTLLYFGLARLSH
jgi:hypothetical protein